MSRELRQLIVTAVFAAVAGPCLFVGLTYFMPTAVDLVAAANAGAPKSAVAIVWRGAVIVIVALLAGTLAAFLVARKLPPTERKSGRRRTQR